MRKHAHSVWYTRLETDRPYQFVRPNGDEITLCFMPGGADGFSLRISRSDARLLAKRINQCLDATVKK